MIVATNVLHSCSSGFCRKRIEENCIILMCFTSRKTRRQKLEWFALRWVPPCCGPFLLTSIFNFVLVLSWRNKIRSLSCTKSSETTGNTDTCKALRIDSPFSTDPMFLTILHPSIQCSVLHSAPAMSQKSWSVAPLGIYRIYTKKCYKNEYVFVVW